MYRMLQLSRFYQVSTLYDAGCGSDQFQCSDGQCIPDYWICDGDNDCGDLADEQNCGGTIVQSLQQCTYVSDYSSMLIYAYQDYLKTQLPAIAKLLHIEC